VLLVVDDEALKRVTLQIELSEAGYEVHEAQDATTALRVLNEKPVDVVISDIRMPEMDGIRFMERIKADFPRTHVILMTAFGTVDAAVEAIKRGAYDYITKPFETEALLARLEVLLASRKGGTGEWSSESETLGSLVGRSFASRRLFEQIRAVADNERTLVIHGEPGTCRERVAETIHQLSRRAARPLIKFSCDAVEPEALAAELFGYAPPAPAQDSDIRVGRFPLAEGGTLFLDQVDALPADVQARLLAALEERTIEHTGSGQRVPVDVRLVCATEKELKEEVASGSFREDLYYRLDAVRLCIAPLRDRRDDIPVLAARHLRATAGNGGDTIPSISPQAMDRLVNYHWPGNVRELEHVLERALTFSDGREIQAKDILLPAEAEPSPAEEASVTGNGGLTETIAGVERSLILAALRRATGNQARAAQFLGIPRTTLRDKMTKYGMVGKPAE
jgi:DNA-binding NtrC family response regulator